MMTLDRPQSSPNTVNRDNLATTLGQAYRAIDQARNVSTALLSVNHASAYGIGWDVAPIIDRAATTLLNLATAHDLPIAGPRDHRREALSVSSATDARMALHPHLRAAFAELEHAAALAETLTTADHTYGAIGWDLETAIDDVVIDVRHAAHAAGLSRQRFWVGVL